MRYCNTKTSRNGVNNMWILKNSTSLLSSLDQLDVRTATSVQTFDFSTLYTSIPHDLLKSRISNLVHNAFRKKDGSVRHTHIKVTRAQGYFTHDINGGGDNLYTADNICKTIEFLIDNIFVQFGGRLFRQVIGIPMGTNCAPLLADLFLYSYENEFLGNMINSGHRRLGRSFNLCYRYIDDLIVFNNKKFLDYLKEIYPSQLTVEKANKSYYLSDYLGLTFIIDSGGISFQPGYMINAMILTSTLSISHSFPATYHLALLMMCTFHSSLDMHDAAHTMRISDIATSAWLIDFCHKAIEP